MLPCELRHGGLEDKHVGGTHYDLVLCDDCKPTLVPLRTGENVHRHLWQATAVWFYPGQPQVAFLLNCPGSVAEAVAKGVEGTGELFLS